MLCVQAPASEPRQWGHSGDASLAGGRPHADGNHRRVRRAESWGRSNRGRAGVRAVIKDRLLGRPHITGATCSWVLGPDLFSRARFLTLVQALGTRGGLLCALTCCRGSGPTLTPFPQLFPLDFTKAGGERPAGRRLGEDSPPHNIHISNEKTRREEDRGLAHRGCWQNILLGCGFDQVAVLLG